MTSPFSIGVSLKTLAVTVGAMLLVSAGCQRSEAPPPTSSEEPAKPAEPIEEVEVVNSQDPGEFGQWLVGSWVAVDVSQRRVGVTIVDGALIVRAGGAVGPLVLTSRRFTTNPRVDVAIDVSFAYGTRAVRATIRRLGPDSALVSIHGTPLSMVIARES